jgi:hypothetical protein
MSHWKTLRTMLIVGEGRTEEAFLNHVKGIYAPRGCGLSVKIKNAHGRGAKHVVDWTVGQSSIAKYDAVAAMLDTDQDWSDMVARKAGAARVQVLKSEPQFEAMLLRLIGQSDAGDSKALKARLAPFVGNDPLRSDSYAQHFGRHCLEAGRQTEPTIDALLALFS